MTGEQLAFGAPSRDPATAAAIDAADRHAEAATPEWRDLALSAVHWCAAVYAEFTTEEVWARLAERHPDLGPPDGRALGATGHHPVGRPDPPEPLRPEHRPSAGALPPDRGGPPHLAGVTAETPRAGRVFSWT